MPRRIREDEDVIQKSRSKGRKRYKEEGWEYNVPCTLCKGIMNHDYEEVTIRGKGKVEFVEILRWFKCEPCEEEFHENIWLSGSRYNRLQQKQGEQKVEEYKRKYGFEGDSIDEEDAHWGGSSHDLDIGDKLVALTKLDGCWESSWEGYRNILEGDQGEVTEIYAEGEMYERGEMYVTGRFKGQSFSFVYPDKRKRVRPLIRSRRRRAKDN